MTITYYQVDREEVARKLKTILGEEDNILVAVLFGSVLRHDKVRDIDILVYTRKPLQLKQLLLLQEKIEQRLGVAVDLIPYDQAPPTLKYQALKHGKPVIVKDKNLYNKLLAMTIAEQEDLEHKQNVDTETSKE